MKTLKPFYKVAGILFLMYMHLAFIAAIGFKVAHNQASDMNERLQQPVSIIDSEPEAGPGCEIEDWMLDSGYLGDVAEPVASIESWMLDPDYLK
jgi:hypothetical protein